MNKLQNSRLKLAIQKEGRLTEDTLAFLRKSGLEFESYQQKLFSTVRNFPLEILYVRDDDIPDYVSSGTVDLGIIGQNILNEERPKVKKLLNLRFGFCSLVVAVPKETTISILDDLRGKIVATSYPASTRNFFKKNNVSIKVLPISGSVEIAPILGIAQAIVDLTSSGSTLALNDLRVLEKIYDSEAVLIANEKKFKSKDNLLVEKLLTRFRAVLSAKNYKYLVMNVQEKSVPKLRKIIPSLKSTTIFPQFEKGLVSISSIVKEDVIWDSIQRIKQVGASGIIILPIEKVIT